MDQSSLSLRKNNNLIKRLIDNSLQITILSFIVLLPIILYGGIQGSLAITFLLIELLFVSFWVERGISSFSIVGPFTFSIFINSLIGSGIGLNLFYWGLKNQELKSFFFNPSDAYQMQIYALLGCPFAILGYWIIFRKFNLKRFDFQSRISFLNKKQLTHMAFYLLIFAFLEAFISLFFGGWDRSNLDLYTDSTATSSPKGIFIAFSSLKYLGYLISPFLISQSKFSTKNILILSIFLFLTLVTSTGTRSFIIYYFIYSIIGFLIFKTISMKRLKNIMSIFLVLTIIIIPTFQLARGSASFRSTSTTNFSSRISSIAETSTTLLKNKPSQLALFIGGTLYGKINDASIYQNVPSKIPFDGFNNFESLLYIFIPKTFYPNKPSAYDGDAIARRYSQRTIGGLATISFNADLFRRFGIFGIILGNFIFGLIYGFIVKNFFLNFFIKPNNFNFSCILLLYIFNNFSNTVLTNFWYLLYNIPKYLILIYFLFLFTKQRKFFLES